MTVHGGDNFNVSLAVSSLAVPTSVESLGESQFSVAAAGAEPEATTGPRKL